MAALSLAGGFTPSAVVPPQVLFVAGFGIVMLPSMSGALVGRLRDGASHSMAIAIGLAGLVAVIGYWG